MPSKTTKNVPTYIKSLTLENIRCFGSKQELSLLKSDGTLPQWTLLLGDNGVGKTTLLQCLVWMRPIANIEKRGIKEQEIGVKPALDDEEDNEVFFQLIRSKKSKVSKRMQSEIEAEFLEETPFNKNVRTSLKVWATGIQMISIGKKFTEYKILQGKKSKQKAEGEVNLITYSASRRPGKAKIEKNDLSDPLAGIFDETTQLYSPEDILQWLHHAALTEKDERREERSAQLLEIMKEMLVEILPDLKNIADIQIRGPEGVSFSMPYGYVPFSHISLGYKTTLTWTVDLAWRLIRTYKDSPNPLAEPAVVLIDEIDLHLHPLWQRKIIDFLSKHFPKTQFIATAHSPLMVQAAIDSNHAVLKQNGEEVEINNNPMATYGWRIDQILTSDFFDLPTSRGPEYESLLEERKTLLDKKRRTPSENNELMTIEKRLAELPTSEKPEDIEAMKLIRDAAAILRNDKDISSLDKNK